jgi:hypothetical protein
MPRWGIQEDAKLAKLFKDRKINPDDLAATTIKEIHLTYFPTFSLANFRVLYKKKCASWRLNQTLNGARGQQGKYFSCIRTGDTILCSHPP